MVISSLSQNITSINLILYEQVNHLFSHQMVLKLDVSLLPLTLKPSSLLLLKKSGE